MTDKHLYIILKVVNYNSNVKQLTREGLTFPRIAELMSEAIREGYLLHTKETIKLSDQGLTKFKDLDARFKKTNKEDWIEKDEKNMIRKLDKNTIFVPNQNELTF